MQASLGVQDVGETEQVALVGAAAVMQDEQAGGLSRRRPLTVDQTHDL
jgi:hypothetical protein